MPHSLSSSNPGLPGEPVHDEPVAAEADPSELPLDRSRFSRWLASFGLGESTLPILRPLKSSRPRGGR